MAKTSTKPVKEFRPSAALLKRARAAAARYTLVIEPKPTGGFMGNIREMPGVIASADTQPECFRRISFGLETVIATYLHDGEEPPPPIGDREKRTEQVNVRFTQTERSLLERESVQQGFRGIGDLIRAEMIRQFGSARPR